MRRTKSACLEFTRLGALSRKRVPSAQGYREGVPAVLDMGCRAVEPVFSTVNSSLVRSDARAAPNPGRVADADDEIETAPHTCVR